MKLQIVACHRKPERSFFYKGKQFPVCARCTGISLGYLIIPLVTLNMVHISIFWCLILLIPTYIDGFLQAFLNKYESTNFRRVATGFIAGVGQGALFCELGKLTGKLIINQF